MSWMQTYTGKQAFPLDLKPEQICIEDIAHHLSLICRFAGACKFHYSVAQHSLLVAQHLPPRLKLAGLMHDAAETYLNDLCRPIKPYMYFHSNPDNPGIVSFERQEDEVERRIFSILGIPWPDEAGWEQIKIEDNRAVMTEARDIMAASPEPWSVPAEPWADTTIEKRYPEQVEADFLALFKELY